MSGDSPLVLVVGDVLNDIVVVPIEEVRDDDDTQSVIVIAGGGSGANQAEWMAHLGLRVRMVARVGRDDADRHLGSLAAAGVEPRLEVDDDVTTGTAVVVTGGFMYTDRGAAARLGVEGLSPELLDKADHLHISGYVLAKPESARAIGGLVSEAANRSIPWSIDPNSAALIHRIGPDRFREQVIGAEMILPNLAEGRALTGATTPEAVLERLRESFPVVAMTLGEGGAMVADGSGVSVAPAAPARVEDTTGAGDAFCAAVINAHLRGSPREGVVAAGLEASALAVQRRGGRPPAPGQ